MKYFLLKSCLLVLICNASAYADSVAMTESLKDRLKCSKSDQSCSVVTVGKLNFTARIAGTTFEKNGIFLADISENTPIEISVGDFAFSSTLADANRHTLTSTKVAAQWPETHDECLDESCDHSKPVIDEKIAVKGDINGIVLKISGKSKMSDFDQYGPRAFADHCAEAEDGTVLNADATLTVDGVDVVGQLEISCRTSVKTVTRYDESFDLYSTTVRARLLNF